MNSVANSVEDSIQKFLKKNKITVDYINAGVEEYLDDLNTKIQKWLSYIDEEDHEIFLFLLENYSYVTRKELKDRLKQLYEKYKEMEENYQQTIFVPVSSFGGVTNGAITIIDCFKEVNRNEVSKKNIAAQSQEFYDKFNLDDVKNIVFLDDIIGSGTTFLDFWARTLKKTPKVILGKNIYLMSLYNLQKGVDLINNDLKDWEIRLINDEITLSIYEDENIYTVKELKEKISKHKGLINKYEKEIWKNSKIKYIGGYKRSNILLSFYYNTPNNTFSTFWKGIENLWYPFFPRSEDEDKHEVKESNIFKEIRELREEVKNRKEFIRTHIENEQKRR